MKNSKSGKSLTVGQLLGIGIVLMLFWVFVIPAIQQNLSLMPGGTQTQTQTGNLVDVTKPINFAVLDAFAGSGVDSASLTIYKGSTVSETLTTGSNGLATTTLPYRSGEVLDVKVVKSTSVYWARITVPKMSPTDAQSLQNNPVEIRTYTLGTYTITVIRSTGATVTSGSNFNFTSAGVTQETFTISVFNTADNTGFIPSEDPITGRKLGAFLEVAVTGSAFDKFLVSGLQGYRTTGSGNYWTRTVQGEEISRIKVGTTVTQAGSFTASIVVDSSPASVGNTATLTIRLNVKADEQRFLSLGDKGPDAAVVATFTLNLQK